MEVKERGGYHWHQPSGLALKLVNRRVKRVISDGSTAGSLDVVTVRTGVVVGSFVGTEFVPTITDSQCNVAVIDFGLGIDCSVVIESRTQQSTKSDSIFRDKVEKWKQQRT